MTEVSMDWAAYPTPLRFESGTAVVSTGDGWMIQLPSQEFLHVEGEEQSRRVVGRLLDGRLSPAEALAERPGAGITDLLDALAFEGALAPAPSLRAGLVVVVGDGPPLPTLCAHLEAADVRHELARSVADLDTARPAVVVAIARWLPDTEWRRVDDWSRRNGVPWHRAHAEGRSWYVGPFTIPGTTPSYEDLRLRRLAASEWPQDLLALWAWLDGGGTPAGSHRLSPGASVAGALVAADVLAHLGGAMVPGSDFQVGIEEATGAARRHPVLAVPGGLLSEAR